MVIFMWFSIANCENTGGYWQICHQYSVSIPWPIKYPQVHPRKSSENHNPPCFIPNSASICTSSCPQPQWPRWGRSWKRWAPPSGSSWAGPKLRSPTAECWRDPAPVRKQMGRFSEIEGWFTMIYHQCKLFNIHVEHSPSCKDMIYSHRKWWLFPHRSTSMFVYSIPSAAICPITVALWLWEWR